MQRSEMNEMIEIPKAEYEMLREIYKTVKRQKVLFRIEEAEENYRAGRIKKVTTHRFVEDI